MPDGRTQRPGSPRSYLYVPADRPVMVAGASQRGADAIILDLEDAVVAQAKDEAREGARSAVPTVGEEVETWVRVNADQLVEDVRAVAVPGLRGIMVPKATPQSLAVVANILDGVEVDVDLPRGTFAIIALLESAEGILSAVEVARCRRVVRLGIGEADLAGELGVQRGPDSARLAPLRQHVVVASAAAGIEAPVAPVYASLRDGEALRRTTRALLDEGFRARTAIHPQQVSTINEVFTPSAEEIQHAATVLSLLDDGQGVAVDSDGAFIDAAVARPARDVLARAAVHGHGATSGPGLDLGHEEPAMPQAPTEERQRG